jgi:hypothetical protein
MYSTGRQQPHPTYGSVSPQYAGALPLVAERRSRADDEDGEGPHPRTGAQ